MNILLPQNSWAGEAPVEITLPDDWEVECPKSEGDNIPPLSGERLREAFLSAIGVPPLRQLAAGRTQVAIAFDDLTRPTPTGLIATLVLEELLTAGIQKDNIRFFCALGAHGALSRADFVQKLGADIVREYPVYNHNPYENCVQVGVTPGGVRAFLNREFMECDLKIGIGSVVPHPLNGFGGGGKIVMPGLAAMETIRDTHEAATRKTIEDGGNPIAGSGSLDNDKFRSEIESIVRMSGVDFKIDAVLNTRKEIIGLFMGDPIKEYYAAAAWAKNLYALTLSGPKDIVICNANAKGSEAAIAMYIGMTALDMKNGGELVLINHVPFGQAVHYLVGPFGLGMGGTQWSGNKSKPSFLKNLILFSPYPDYTSASWFCDPAEVVWAGTWEEVMTRLSGYGTGTRTAVITDGTLQYLSG